MLRLLILVSFLSTPVFAGTPIVVNSGDRQTAVVELYTSEGCSSCPRADRWLEKLVTAPQQDLDLLALAFHVDYWDHLGWKDRFSNVDYTKRQRVLGANNRQRTIYTPEFFVNGKEARGSGNILNKIQQTNQQPASITLQLTVSREQSELVVAVQTPSELDNGEPIHHRYLVYENKLSTDVKRGENSGKVLRHEQVVRYMSPAQSLQAENQHRIAIDPAWQAENVGIAVLVTSVGAHRYLQAVHTPVASLLETQ
jgi:hypothetical protein